MPTQSRLNLEAMSMPELQELREQLLAVLARKIKIQREALQCQIAALSRLDATVSSGPPSRDTAPAKRANGRVSPLKGRSVTPNYRDPANSSNTWAGRGQAPRWLTAYEQQSRRRDEFLIGATQAATTKGRRKKRD
jgi:DNA-binding protein H-NS